MRNIYQRYEDITKILNLKLMNPKDEYVEKTVAEFDSKFFIGGRNAYGVERPLLFPAKSEVRDWLTITLSEALEEGARREREQAIITVIKGCKEVTDFHQDTSSENIAVNTARSNILKALSS